MKVVIEDVRLSFPDLFEPKSFGEGKPAYSAKFIVEPKSSNVKKLEDAIAAVAKEKWGEKAEGVLGVINDAKKSAWTRGPYRNSKTGDVYDGFEGKFHLNARTGGDKPGPKTYNRAKQEVGPRDGVFYPGCYVDAVLDIYAQDHPQYGRHIELGVKGEATAVEPAYAALRAGLAASKGEARRLITQGGVSWEEKKVTDEKAVLAGGILKVGKRRFLRLKPQ